MPRQALLHSIGHDATPSCTCGRGADTDRQRLQAALAGTFTRGQEQDLGFGDGKAEERGGLQPGASDKKAVRT